MLIATGSNNTARYFDYYFGRFPISYAVTAHLLPFLIGNETADELESLADDVHLYFDWVGRNVYQNLCTCGV